MTEEDKKAWDVTVHRANRGNEFFSIYDANAILYAAAELKRLHADLAYVQNCLDTSMLEAAALRADNARLEKVAADFDEAIRGDYHRDGIKIRIVVTQDSLNKYRTALDALKEG